MIIKLLHLIFIEKEWHICRRRRTGNKEELLPSVSGIACGCRIKDLELCEFPQVLGISKLFVLLLLEKFSRLCLVIGHFIFFAE